MKTKQLDYISPMPAAERENNEINNMVLCILIGTVLFGIALVAWAYFGG